MHTAQGGQQARSLSYETGSLVRIDLTTYSDVCLIRKSGSSPHQRHSLPVRRRVDNAATTLVLVNRFPDLRNEGGAIAFNIAFKIYFYLFSRMLIRVIVSYPRPPGVGKAMP